MILPKSMYTKNIWLLGLKTAMPTRPQSCLHRFGVNNFQLQPKTCCEFSAKYVFNMSEFDTILKTPPFEVE